LIRLSLVKDKNLNFSARLHLIFLLFLLFTTAGCRAAKPLPLKYLNLKNDFDEQTLYSFFSSNTSLKEAKKIFSVKENVQQREEAKLKLLELAPAEKKEKVKGVFAQFSPSSIPSVPVLIAEGRFKGKKALFLVEIWASGKEKTFSWVRLWVFEEENLRLLYALSFKNPF